MVILVMHIIGSFTNNFLVPVSGTGGLPTASSDLASKLIYDRNKAQEIIRKHAAHFVGSYMIFLRKLFDWATLSR